MEPYCEKGWQLKTAKYFFKKAPSPVLDSVLNTPLTYKRDVEFLKAL